jgi:hypothetical protein
VGDGGKCKESREAERDERQRETRERETSEFYQRFDFITRGDEEMEGRQTTRATFATLAPY